MSSAVTTEPTVQLLSIQQLAKICGLSHQTIRRLMNTPPFPTPIRPNFGSQGAVRFRKSDVDIWIANGCGHNPGEKGAK